jgi:hypothetical protein
VVRAQPDRVCVPVSRRRRDALYAGAAGTVRLEDIAQLGARHVVQPKLDGAYVTVLTDSSGRVRHVITRGGEVNPGPAQELLGVVHVPDSVLVGELEAYSEAGNRAAATVGHRRVHLFDALRVGGRDVTGETYAARRDALRRAEAQLELARTWTTDDRGAAHDRAGRFVRRVPHDYRRMPVVPQWPASEAPRAWADLVEAGGAEGLVAVALDAPVGRRGAKRRCKPVVTLDAVTVACDGRAASLLWAGNLFVVSARGTVGKQIRPGVVVEVACNGWHEAGCTPKHARIVRVRDDLRSVPAGPAPAPGSPASA